MRRSIPEIPVRLVNTKGELVASILPSFSNVAIGSGFAVPTSMSKPIYESLVKNGKVVRGFLGVSIQDLSQDLAKSFGIKDAKGALVSDVKDEGPADQAGITQGDIITTYQGVPVEDAVALQRQVTKTAVGRKWTVRVIRGPRERRDRDDREQPESVKTARAETGETDYAFAGWPSRISIGTQPRTRG